MKAITKHSKRLAKYYNQLCIQYMRSHKTVGWYSFHTQKERFKVLTEGIDFSGQTILDVGCGQGGFLGYLRDNDIPFLVYEGIDLSEHMIAIAKADFPNHFFHSQDLFDLDPKDHTYDYCVASGPFNHRLDCDQYRYIAQIVEKLSKLAKKGIAFNLLSDKTPFSNRDDHEFFYYNSGKVLDIVRDYFRNASLVSGYLPNDFTIYGQK